MKIRSAASPREWRSGDRFELEHRVVTKGAVEAQVRVLITAEKGPKHAQDGEDGRLPAARSSSEKTPSGSITLPVTSVRYRTSRSVRGWVALNVRYRAGSRTDPRLLSATTRNERPRPSSMSGGSTKAISNRQYSVGVFVVAGEDTPAASVQAIPRAGEDLFERDGFNGAPHPHPTSGEVLRRFAGVDPPA